MILHKTDGTLNPGKYNYQFTYQLPPDLPSIYYDDGIINSVAFKAAIMYKVKAYLLSDSGVTAKYTQGIIINETSMKLNQITPVKNHQKKEFMFATGALTTDITFDRPTFYIPGDVITIKLTQDNETKKFVVANKIKLMRNIKIKAEERTPNHHASFNESHTYEVCRIQYDGCGTNTKQTNDLVFALPPHNIAPTIQTDLISNSYFLMIECDIPLAFDMESKYDIAIAIRPKGDGDVKLYSGYVPKSW